MPIICCKYKTLCFVLITAIVFFYFIGCEKENFKSDSNTLALIGKRTINKNYFIKRYQDFQRQTGASDNGLARRSVLNNLIAEELLIREARHRGYDDDTVGRQELQRISVQELLNAYHHRFISTQVTTTEEELRQLFINLNIKLKARHLYAPTRQRADSLYLVLQQGSSFEELAKTCFQDPVLRDSGGLLGYFTVDEMDPAFEEAAYALPIGEISAPVRTNDGYSIIRVDDRIGNPLVTESEFAKHRPKLEAYWTKRKIARATQRHADSLRSELNITFNEPVIQQLFASLKQQTNNELIEHSDLSKHIDPQLENADLVYSKLGTWDIKKFQEAALFTSQQERGWIRNEDNLRDYIAGLVVRSFILTEAKKNKLGRTSDYQQAVTENFETALLERIEDVLFKEFEIPEDTLRHYYEEDRTRFAEPPRVQLQEIALLDQDKVKTIVSQLEQGASFADLAQKYSENRRSAENGGDIGYLTPNDLGRWATQVLAMKVGEWIGPLEMNSSFVFLKCIDKIPPQARSFEAARHEVEQALRPLLWEQVRQQQVESLRATTAPKSYPEKLMEIQLN